MLGASPQFLTVEHLSANAKAYQNEEGRVLEPILKALSDGDALILTQSQRVDGLDCCSLLLVMHKTNCFGDPHGISVDIRSEFPISAEQALEYADTLSRTLEALPLEYKNWIYDVVRCVVVDFYDRLSLNSSTDVAKPHIVFIAGNQNAACIMEMLVHEASHLQYNANISSGLICKPSAPLVFSAFTRCLRPLERVIFAYHAARNINASLSVIDNSDSNRRKLKEDMEKLQEAIFNNWDFLTEYGRRFVNALP